MKSVDVVFHTTYPTMSYLQNRKNVTGCVGPWEDWEHSDA
jgi:hypothetical protein